MEVIASGRRTGRTTKLIEMCAEAEKNSDMVYIVTHDHAAARAIVNLARELGHIIRYPITYDEMRISHGINRNAKLMIDNVELLIGRQTAGHEVLAVTITTNEK